MGLTVCGAVGTITVRPGQGIVIWQFEKAAGTRQHPVVKLWQASAGVGHAGLFVKRELSALGSPAIAAPAKQSHDLGLVATQGIKEELGWR